MSVAFPSLLREQRLRRRWSQEHLSLEARVSPRHLSCLETGKASPSREMVLMLARALDLELRERNTLLLAAGYAASYPQSPLDGSALAPLNRAIDLLSTQQEPYGAVLIDRCWNVLRSNKGAHRLFGTFLDATALSVGVATNLMRATLHPAGLRPYIVNFAEVAAVAIDRIERAALASGFHPKDEARRALLAEVRAYPGIAVLPRAAPSAAPMAVLHLRRGADELRLFALLTTIGTPLDITAEDLTLESFFPADEPTERWFRT